MLERLGQADDDDIARQSTATPPPAGWSLVILMAAALLYLSAGGLAARARAGDRPQAGLPQRAPQRHHARRALFPGGERLHADLRADAQRQPRARLALPAGRLYRLRDRGTRPAPGCSADRRVRRHRARRHRPAVHHLPLDGRAGPAPDAGHDRHLDRAGRPHAVVLGRRLLPGADAGLAERPDRSCRWSPACAASGEPSTCRIRWCGS